MTAQDSPTEGSKHKDPVCDVEFDGRATSFTITER